MLPKAASNDLVEAVKWFGQFKKINSENLAPKHLLMKTPFRRKDKHLEVRRRPRHDGSIQRKKGKTVEY